jgi:hypothetical protein
LYRSPLEHRVGASVPILVVLEFHSQKSNRYASGVHSTMLVRVAGTGVGERFYRHAAHSIHVQT